MKKIFTIVAGSLFFFQVSHAQLQELAATPEVTTETGATFLILEVNFKHPENDFVRMRYQSPSDQPLNLKNIGFGDDSVFKKIENDIWIASGQELLLTFKKSDPDTVPYFYTPRTGLTATTEQFIIYNSSGEILDAVCWTSTEPTASEITDLKELFEKEAWASADIASCLPSDGIETGTPILRKEVPDTNASADWSLPVEEVPVEEVSAEVPEPEQTTPEVVELTIEETGITQPEAATEEEMVEADPTNSEELSIQNPELVELKKPATVAKKTAKKNAKKSTTKKTKTSAKKYLNGDLSDELIITEILPNPEKNDAKNEWIEITNVGETPLNLGNWQLNDGEGGSKPYIIPDTVVIEGGAAYLFPITETRIGLGNASDRVHLIDFEDTLVDEIEYTEAPAGKSYALITVLKEESEEETEWLWVDEPTPGETNPLLEEITVVIVSEPEFGVEAAEGYNFEAKILDEEGEPIDQKKIAFDEATVAAPLAKVSFTKGTKAKLLVQEGENESYRLKKYEVLEPPQPEASPESASFLWVAIAGIGLCIGAAGYFVYKKAPWQKTEPKTEPSAETQNGSISDIITM